MLGLIALRLRRLLPAVLEDLVLRSSLTVRGMIGRACSISQLVKSSDLIRLTLSLASRFHFRSFSSSSFSQIPWNNSGVDESSESFRFRTELIDDRRESEDLYFVWCKFSARSELLHSVTRSVGL